MGRYKKSDISLFRNRDWLHEQYIIKGRTQRDIAKECGVHYDTIYCWIFKFGLRKKRLYRDRDWLYNQYVLGECSSREIAMLCGTAKYSILYWLKKHEIPIRTYAEGGRIYYKNHDGPRKGIKVSLITRKRSSESHTGLKQTEETKRKKSASMRGIAFEDWTGYASMLLYDSAFNEVKREEVRNRDGRTCVLCGKSELFNHGQRLAVHHIDGNKKNSDTSNLVALCLSCNNKTDTIEKEFLVIANSVIY